MRLTERKCSASRINTACGFFRRNRQAQLKQHQPDASSARGVTCANGTNGATGCAVAYGVGSVSGVASASASASASAPLACSASVWVAAWPAGCVQSHSSWATSSTPCFFSAEKSMTCPPAACNCVMLKTLAASLRVSLSACDHM